MRRTNAQGREARDRIGKDRGNAKKRTKPQKIHRRDVDNGGDSGGGRTKCTQEHIDSVDVSQECLDNRI